MINFKFRSSQAFKMAMGLCLCTFSLLVAETIHVNEGDNLQQAIDAAAPGDTLKLQGTFIGSFIIDKSLILEGQRKNPAILNGNNAGRVLEIIGLQNVLNEGQVSVTLRNLIIENGVAKDGGGILNQFARLTIEFVKVRNNLADNSGGGIASALGELNIKRSLIKNNIAKFGGGGINSLNGALFIQQSGITDNTVQQGSGGGIVANSSVINIIGTSILRNQSLGTLTVGGGIDNEAKSDMTIKHCIIKKNKAHSGAGIYNAANLTVEKSLISANQAVSSLARFQARGGGLFNASTGTAKLKKSIVRLNEAGTPENPGSGGGIFNNNGIITLEKTRVKRNTPDDIVPPIVD